MDAETLELSLRSTATGQAGYTSAGALLGKRSSEGFWFQPATCSSGPAACKASLELDGLENTLAPSFRHAQSQALGNLDQDEMSRGHSWAHGLQLAFGWKCQTLPAYPAQSKRSSGTSLYCACRPPNWEDLLAQGKHWWFTWNQLRFKCWMSAVSTPRGRGWGKHGSETQAALTDSVCWGYTLNAAHPLSLCVQTSGGPSKASSSSFTVWFLCYFQYPNTLSLDNAQ